MHISRPRSRQPLAYDYALKGYKLTVEEVSKYLGVYISKDLSWEHVDHVDKIISKWSNTLGFLWRNYIIDNEDLKGAAYFPGVLLLSLEPPQPRSGP